MDLQILQWIYKCAMDKFAMDL